MMHNHLIIGDKSVKPDVESLHKKLEREVLSNDWNVITLCSAFLTQTAAKILINESM